MMPYYMKCASYIFRFFIEGQTHIILPDACVPFCLVSSQQRFATTDQCYSSPVSQDFIKQTTDSILQKGEGQQTVKEWPQLSLAFLFYILCLLPPWSLNGSAVCKIGLMPAIDQEFNLVLNLFLTSTV